MKDRSSIHIAATFKNQGGNTQDKDRMRSYIRTMLDDENLLYSNTLVIENGEGKMTVQVKLEKAAVNLEALKTVIGILEALEGHLDTWVITESVMGHPEIYSS